MELSDYLRVLRTYWIGVLVLTALGAGLAAGYTLTQPKVYAANANGLVTIANPTSNGSAGLPTNDPNIGVINDTLARSKVKAYVEIATSRSVAQRVIDDLGLKSDPAGLIGSISVDQPLDTPLLKITAKASSPRRAQDLADAWVKATAAEIANIENPDGADQPSAVLQPVEAAELPTAPVSPKPSRNLALGIALGLLLGVAYAVVRSRLDRRLKSSTNFDKEYGVAVVGRVPGIKQLETEERTGVAQLAVSKTAGSSGWEAGEAFRKLRTSISYMDVDQPPKIIVVTSPQPGDGKSTTAANLAAAIAISGQPVTLVDGDLRRPSVADGFGLVEGAGLTDVLIGRVTLDDVLQESPDFEGLTVLAAGSIPPNPSELLGSKAMEGLIQELARDGMVIIDAPPLLPVTDAAVLSRECDGAIVVVSHNRTLDAELTDALTALTAVQGRVLGVVVNRVPRKESGTGYYTGYYTTDVGAAPAKAGGRRRG
ncbi:polysaccharide biosynthesis tyrosine autokinase [Nocardioides sp. TRM66260-LWL]|uniref:polysaccharide biosynthesis tyrosine autokinase n=1 Tax=Nocardioides sp. TRM66260-LWL TaxID=2874478 RepID=UPI001CC398C0|nr:polysaccharide biosynthesis tyrosine autokinase [Nocardioides sp. TRM66260-LWL]MBZ5734928.1 polysaccharide biosynthesis tyrosine autokinase [Nocardioides sp. TRM66260-LWL]